MTDTPPTITPREREVLRLMCEGLESKAIATRLRIAERTVEIHRRNLRKKTGCRTACQLGVWAVRNGLAGDDGWTPVRLHTGPTMPFAVIVPTGVVRE